ncbi:AsmA family protein [Telmatobacter sp. DSM 110680]|uniref:AsmA family protein n=1 Tax=Telmatobacter sp. DSM 110680 TaxID=3036704 RepID=A0AAU7DI19_9BACT
MRKRILVIVGSVVGVLVIIALILPFVINANRFKPELESQLSSALGRPTTIGNIELALFSGGVRADDFVIADDPAFSHSPFVTAKRVNVGVDLMSLIFSKKLEVKSFTLTEPQVSLIRSRAGDWNFSTLGNSSSSQSAGGKSSATSDSSVPAISVDKLTVSNGVVILGTLSTPGKIHTYQNVELEASNLSYASQFPFTLTLKTPGNGSMKLDGKAGPINVTNTILTPLSAKLNIQKLDLALTGFVDPSTGIAGIVDLDGDLTSDGASAKLNGSLNGQKLKFTAGGSPATVPISIDYATTYFLKNGMGNLTKGDIHVGKALAQLSGDYNTSEAETTLQMKLLGQGMPVPDLEGALPAAGIALPSGASLKSGSLDLNLAINGSVDKLVITGPVNLSNAKLAGFDLKSKLGALSSFTALGKAGSGSDTVVRSLHADLRQDPGGTHAANLKIVVESIGTIAGDANLSASQQLDCKMTANLSGALGVVAAPVALLGKGKSGGGIPFSITGTASNPIFRPDLGSEVGNLAKGLGGLGSATGKGVAGSAKGLLGGVLGKKKSN